MQQYLLSFLIFTPLIAALIALFIPSPFEKFFRFLSLVTSLVQILVLVQLMQAYEPSVSLQFVEQNPGYLWISVPGEF